MRASTTDRPSSKGGPDAVRTSRVFHAVDSHTEGMPTRVITGGVGVLPGDTMAARAGNGSWPTPTTCARC